MVVVLVADRKEKIARKNLLGIVKDNVNHGKSYRLYYSACSREEGKKKKPVFHSTTFNLQQRLFHTVCCCCWEI